MEDQLRRQVDFTSANYTWSHALDYNQNEATFTDTNDQVDPFNLRLEYGNSIYDVPNRFVFSAVLDSPWKADGFKGLLVNGWELAPLFQEQNGVPFTLVTSGSAPGGLLSGINGSGGRQGVPVLQRNFSRLPNSQVMDLRASKHFSFHDRYSVELIGEAFNLFNHQNATSENTTGYRIGGTAAAPTLTYQTNYGAVTNANSNFAYSTRQVQLAARFVF